MSETSAPLPQPQASVAALRARRYAAPRTIAALMLREMSTRYGRSPGGYVWAVLEPLGTILLLSFALGYVFKSPSLGDSFILFYATGYLPFGLYQAVALYVARALMFSRPLLFYPSVTWVDAIIARFVLNAVTFTAVSYILLSGILFFTQTTTVIDMAPIIISMALAALLGLGIGTLNCLLIGLIPAWDIVWSIATRPLFLASGIIFILEDMPRVAQDILWYNPLIHVTGMMRTGLYPMYNASYVSVTYVAAVGMITLVLGMVLLSRYHRQILNDG